ncbi:MAG: translation initiation factor [Chitinophagaceae bacterium]|nr:translation initiation factor [Chitinophagaceae bacterium]
MSNKNKHLKGVVFSTDPGYQYQQQEVETSRTLPGKQQNLSIRIEKNHRGGKTVTVVDGFIGSTQDLEELGQVLKKKCGVGGSAKDGLILIQGAQKERVVKMLLEMGYKAK